MSNKDLDDRLKQLAEDTIDRLNADDPDPGRAMLTSYILIVEGNGIDSNGDPLSRNVSVASGSTSQIKGLLVDELDAMRADANQ